MAAKVFISYRREDSADVTGRIDDRLYPCFGRDQVFKDVDSIPPGVDFRKHLDGAVSRCNIVLVVIGPNWLEICGEDGKRRLDDESDWVRFEIETALRRDIQVVPVLVRHAKMPRATQLPEALRELAFRNAIDVRPDPDFHHDMERLIKAVEQSLLAPPETASPAAVPGESDRAAGKVLVDAGQLASCVTQHFDKRPSDVPAPRSRRRLMWLGGLAMVATIAVTIAAIASHAWGPRSILLSGDPPSMHPPSSGPLPSGLLPSAPSPPEPWLPEGFQTAPGAKVLPVGARLLATRIVCTRHGLNVPFVLVTKNPNQADEPPSFYIMENKVSNGLYEKFVESSGSLAGSTWKKPQPSGAGATAVDVDQLPVMYVSCEDACRFAHWLGGRLPTIEQWDKAAGRMEARPGLGPFEGSWNPQEHGGIAVGRQGQGPMAVGTATADVSVFGCRDMAGNGEEWTRTSKDAAVTLPLKTPNDSVGVLLRGQSYAASKPLYFSDWEDFGTEMYYRDKSEIGFRVVFDQCPP